MRILFIGDIVGRPGRDAVVNHVARLRADRMIDIVIANAENAAGGLGVTPEILLDLRQAGIDGFTLGNHTWRKKVMIKAIDGMADIVRPANYAREVPGQGSMIVPLRDGRKLGVVNLIGRIYMEPNRDPFLVGEKEVARLREQTPIVLVDMHAEASSEKIAMGWHMEGRCTAVVGTHTHVQTADDWVLPGGTAYITDVGMCGPIFSVIGTETDKVLEKFLTGLPRDYNVAKGPAMFCAVIIDADDETGKARSIERLLLRDELEGRR